MKRAGVAQHLERRGPQPEAADANPAARSMAQAFAAGLALDPASWQRGYDDACAGLRFAPPPAGDALAYAAGWVAGERWHRCPKLSPKVSQ